MTSLKLGKISYINAFPVYYGLDLDSAAGRLPSWLEMVPDVPAVLNDKLLAGEVDISPISAAFYAMHHEELLILPDFSISCNGPVISVICVSHYPLEELDGKKVLFSKESVSSSSFLAMIFSRMGIAPHYQVGPVGNMEKIPSDVDAVLVIGDDALSLPWEQKFQYRVDLGQAWYEMSALPFVFAVWAVRRDIASSHPDQVEKVMDLLRNSRIKGYGNLERVIDAGQRRLGLDREVIADYYQHLYCDLDDKKVEGMGLFFDSLFEQSILSAPAKIQFFGR